MSYLRSNGRYGLGDTTASCRTGAPFFKDGNWWVPIRDKDGKEYPLMQTPELVALPQCAAASTGGSIWGQLIAGVTDVFKAKVTPGATSTTIIQGGGGMSTTTKVALGAAAVVGLALILKSRK